MTTIDAESSPNSRTGNFSLFRRTNYLSSSPSAVSSATPPGSLVETFGGEARPNAQARLSELCREPHALSLVPPSKSTVSSHKVVGSGPGKALQVEYWLQDDLAPDFELGASFRIIGNRLIIEGSKVNEKFSCKLRAFFVESISTQELRTSGQVLYEKEQ